MPKKKKPIKIEEKSLGKESYLYTNPKTHELKEESLCNHCGSASNGCKISTVIVRRVARDHKISFIITQCPYWKEKK